jgi:hypothetical protein
MSALPLDEFVPEASPDAPPTPTSARFLEVPTSASHLDEFAPEALPEAPAPTSPSKWRVTLMVGGGLVLGVVLSYFLFLRLSR